ncbi:excinuclease ABC subunit UvrB [bacterium]|nr:MAG: excinuclease ABC subunit UvrB [bacterium]QQR61411.1 MAG: excinuclease ABC subunit UvrB [bacterium]
MKKPLFKIHSPFEPAGSQPEAIEKLTKNLGKISTLMGVTGSGKTFTIAHVIAKQVKPVLILAPNKTLAAQLYEEFSLFFPENKVCYFVSYYDYYQPESYLPAQDIYVPKETKINSEIERLRVEATASLINRPDTIVIASVSCIYSLGNPTDYKELAFSLQVGQKISRQELLKQLIFIQYKRNDIDRNPGTFAVVGTSVEVILPYQKDKLRIELFGSTIEELCWVGRLTNNVNMKLDNTLIFPAKHFVTPESRKELAITSIEKELAVAVGQLSNPVYQERLKQRIEHDIEMLKETGYCNGIENYSSHFDGRKAGEPPYCLLDFFPEDFLLVVDESHIALAQLRGMYAGDRARKKSLIEYGFRLPSSYENRPLQFEEIERYFKNSIFVSATPGPYEIEKSKILVEQIIRPTGLVDPEIVVRPRINQLADLISEIEITTEKGFRSLVMVMTKKLAEELARFLEERMIKVCYLHSELKTPQRTELLQKLRMGEFDCLVGVNLLREGIDLPEVALVAIMDADLESFLRDKRSLIQIIGRAARNTQARVLLYADRITGSMHDAMAETDRRRTLQLAYNKKHGIIPKTVQREVVKSITGLQEAIGKASPANKKAKNKKVPTTDIDRYIAELETEMQAAAERLDFETAITLRQKLFDIKRQK